MSIQTLRKRIAVVAVSALTAGVLSVMSAPVANAAIAAGNLDFTTATDAINVGTCAIDNTTSATTATAINGSLVQLKQAASITDAVYLSLSGPGYIESYTAASATVTPTTLTDSATAQNDVYNIRLNGIGTITVTYAASSTAAATDSITINSVASCATSTFDATTSNTTIVDVLEADSDATEAVAWVARFNGQDTADEEIIPVAGTGYIRSQINNAYGANLSEKAMIATSTAGCFVGLANITTSAPSIATTATTAVLSSTGADVVVAVKAATAGVPANCTVTLSWNGITVGTETFKQLGVPASVTVSGQTVGVKSGSGYYRATVKDSLGNPLPAVSISASATETNNAAAATIVSDAAATAATTATTTNASTGAIRGTTPAIIADNLASAAGKYTCTSKGGAAKITVRVLSSGVTYVTSAPFDVYCGAASVDTWAISMDKASYSPGEIATLTVSAKDADGHIAQSLLTLGASEYSFGGMTFVTAPTTADLFNSAAGVKIYKLSVGTTEGSFVGTFKITGTTDTAAKTVQYAVKSSTATVSNADVLKSIVALIASINKQIQALQKLILKR